MRESSVSRNPIEDSSPRARTADDLAHVAFPIGGIGTGSISIDGAGRLRDFEVFNRPSKGSTFDYTFLTLYARPEGAVSVTRVLQGPLHGRGLAEDALSEGIRRTGVGLPHFRETEFVGRFPFGEVRFHDPDFPLDVRLEAFSPFIPLDPEDSGLPAAWLTTILDNPLEVPVEVVLYANLENRVGSPDVGGGRVEYFDAGSVRGLRMSSTRHPVDSPRHGTLVLATPHRTVLAQTHWLAGPDGWFMPLQDFWDQVSTDGFREMRDVSVREDGCDVGSLGLRAMIPAGGSIRLPIWIVWHTPNLENYWTPPGLSAQRATLRNRYAVRFANAQAVAEYIAQSAASLEDRSRAFSNALWQSTLPEPVLDAVASQLSTLRTTTCLRLADGTIWGWEGCDSNRGVGEGTCSHVWNYAQALPYLFPSLERSIRDTEYSTNLHPDGHMSFRTSFPPASWPVGSFHAAADGQLGGVLRTYREWRISGDERWLASIWPAVRRSLEYAWLVWDRDRDGVIEGLQHNTYDIEFLGPNPLIGTLYLAALEAAARIATRLGQHDFASECRELRDRGSAWIDEHLFNGEYYEQEVRPEAGTDAIFPITGVQGQVGPLFQVATGCLSDQLIGQWYAFMLDLGFILKREHVTSAARAVFRHNWRSNLWDHVNALRILAHEDEGGLLLASWPRGGRPAIPVQYCDEVWTGIEYEVAALLTYLGLVDEALIVVKACRDRYSGSRRNPWSEMEYGNHYARGMAAYSLLLAFSGFNYSAPDRFLSFSPKLAGRRFRCFFSVDSGWGSLYRTESEDSSEVRIEIESGSLEIERAILPLTSVARVTVGTHQVEPIIDPQADMTALSFRAPIVAIRGRPIIVSSR